MLVRKAFLAAVLRLTSKLVLRAVLGVTMVPKRKSVHTPCCSRSITISSFVPKQGDSNAKEI